MDYDNSHLDDVQDAAIKFIMFAHSIQQATDKRLNENFITRNFQVNECCDEKEEVDKEDKKKKTK